MHQQNRKWRNQPRQSQCKTTVPPFNNFRYKTRKNVLWRSPQKVSKNLKRGNNLSQQIPHLPRNCQHQKGDQGGKQDLTKYIWTKSLKDL